MYLDEINHFDATVTLQPRSYGELIKEENGAIYFYTKSAVYTFTPKTREISQILELNDLDLSSNDSNSRFWFSGVTADGGNVLVECAEYIKDIQNSKTTILCSSSGDVLQSLK